MRDPANQPSIEGDDRKVVGLNYAGNSDVSRPIAAYRKRRLIVAGIVVVAHSFLIIVLDEIGYGDLMFFAAACGMASGLVAWGLVIWGFASAMWHHVRLWKSVDFWLITALCIVYTCKLIVSVR